MAPSTQHLMARMAAVAALLAGTWLLLLCGSTDGATVPRSALRAAGVEIWNATTPGDSISAAGRKLHKNLIQTVRPPGAKGKCDFTVLNLCKSVNTVRIAIHYWTTNVIEPNSGIPGRECRGWISVPFGGRVEFKDFEPQTWGDADLPRLGLFFDTAERQVSAGLSASRSPGCLPLDKAQQDFNFVRPDVGGPIETETAWHFSKDEDGRWVANGFGKNCDEAGGYSAGGFTYINKCGGVHTLTRC